MLHYLLTVGSPLIASLLMLDNALPDSKIHGDLNSVNALGGKGAGSNYDFPHLLNKIGCL